MGSIYRKGELLWSYPANSSATFVFTPMRVLVKVKTYLRASACGWLAQSIPFPGNLKGACFAVDATASHHLHIWAGIRNILACAAAKIINLLGHLDPQNFTAARSFWRPCPRGAIHWTTRSGLAGRTTLRFGRFHSVTMPLMPDRIRHIAATLPA